MERKGGKGEGRKIQRTLSPPPVQHTRSRKHMGVRVPFDLGGGGGGSTFLSRNIAQCRYKQTATTHFDPKALSISARAQILMPLTTGPCSQHRYIAQQDYNLLEWSHHVSISKVLIMVFVQWVTTWFYTRSALVTSRIESQLQVLRKWQCPRLGWEGDDWSYLKTLNTINSIYKYLAKKKLRP